MSEHGPRKGISSIRSCFSVLTQETILDKLEEIVFRCEILFQHLLSFRGQRHQRLGRLPLKLFPVCRSQTTVDLSSAPEKSVNEKNTLSHQDNDA